MANAPIAFFAYKRPEHTKRALEALSNNYYAKESELFVFCDGAKCQKDEEFVQRVRDVVRSQQWCKQVHVIERSYNWGLANSIIAGVTELCREFGKVIVLEDDLVTSPYFLKYMNHALNLYADIYQVMQLSGHMFPVNLQANTDAIFLPFTTSWGWATWERAWRSFDADSKSYFHLKHNRNLRYQFNLNGSYPYFNMLEDHLNNKIDSWAIRWYLSVFVQRGLTLYPTKSLVSNIGFDGSGTHCGKDNVINDFISYDAVLSFPKGIDVNEKFFKSVISYLSIHSRSKQINISKIRILISRALLS